MDKGYISENAATSEKLVSLIDQLREEDYFLDAGDGWDIRVILAHLAFWVLRTGVLMKRGKREGVRNSPIDLDVMNESLLSILRSVPPRAAAELAVSAAKAADREVESLRDDLAMEVEGLGDKRRLGRHIHRRMHIDQIEGMLERRK